MEYKWRCLIAVCFGTFMATMDFSIVNVALPTLSREFDKPPDTVVWVALASSLMVTGITLTAGRIGDLYGRKRVYITGWVIFTVGMLVASFAQTIEQLIAFRFFQAIGVALAIANGNAIVTEAFPPEQRGQALGTTGSVVGAGLMTGPIVGGLILEGLSWQAIFYLRAPIGVIAMTLAFLFIRPSAPSSELTSRKVDIPGAITLFATLSSALLAVNRGTSWGWGSPVILGLFAFSACALASFLRVESRAVSPVIALGLFKVRSYAVGVSSLALNFAGQSAVTFLMPFYLQQVRGYSTGQTGLVIATVPSMMLLLSPISGRVSDRFGFRHQTTAGIVLVSIGLLLMSTIDASTPIGLVMARLAVIGVGTSIFMSPNSASIMGSVPKERLGTASASVATARNIGNATGLAMASAILVGVASTSAGFTAARVADLPAEAILDGVTAAFLAAAAVSSLAIVASSFRGKQARPVTPPASQVAPAIQE
ncbi:MAG: MFS transporter [Dehalococcoidia bacterium]|nr:MFS transporter [Dehalococcoidia bacterium]